MRAYLFLIGACFTLQAVAVADDAAQLQNWPQWRGPLWNGVAPHSDPPVIWSESENVKWNVPVDGSGWSTPIIWEDRIFLHTAIPFDEVLPIPDVIPKGTPNIGSHPDVSPAWKPQRIAILCLDRITGKELWRRIIFEGMPHQGHHRKGGFASQSPVTDGEHVYSYFGSFGLHCHDMEGRLVWKKDFAPQAMEDSLGEGSSPALYGDTIIIAADQEGQSYVVAINKNNGEEIWKTNRDEVSNWSTPRIFTHAGQRQIVLNGETVCCYDFQTGKLLWSCGGQNASALPMPAVGHGLVFTASGWRRDVVQAIELGHCGDLTGSEHVAWTLDRGAPYVPCPMIWGDELYLLEDHSFFSCLRAVDGKQYYLKHRLPGGLNFSASPVGAADRIYLLSEDGKTVVLHRGKEPEILSINQLPGTFHASPAIVGNQIFIRSADHLFCIE